ncbi:hypothetical protein [Tsukamurella hominis]|uniref:hypothetical protein n=1 Tax=Tsukamurella hominis TaxID=1970232 RepID=UPI0039EAA771
MNPYFYDGVAPELVWTEFWRRWDFNGWIKPMIDDAASIGTNAVRIFGNTNVVTSGAISLDEYLRRWKQVLDYVTAKNLYALPCGGDLSHWGRLTTRASAEQIYRAWAGLLSNYPRVVGVDVTNEASDQSQTTTPLSYSQPEPWLETIRTLGEITRSASHKPITHSRAIRSKYSWRSGCVATDSLSDFLSIHCYYTPDPDDPVALSQTPWGAGKELVLGEFGTDAGAPASEWQARYAAVVSLIARSPARVGGLVWPTYDATPGASSPFQSAGVSRSDVVASFATLPTAR